MKGVALALLAYAAFSSGDALVKSLRGSLSVFEVGFFMTLVGCVFAVAAKPRGERWAEVLRPRRPWAVQARAACSIVAGWLGIHAFTTLPFADAYALIFLVPLFVTLFSAVRGEAIGPWRWGAVLVGFAGVLLVVRPGFETFETGHLAAIGVAAASATGIIILRTVAAGERRSTIVTISMGYGLIANSIAMAWSFRPPTTEELVRLGIAGVAASIGQFALVAAAARAPASQVAAMQYSQMFWAIGIGMAFFAEYPDAATLGGLAVIAGAGLLTLVREQIRARMASRS